MRSNWKRVLLNLALDIALAGIVLVVFALFHHVIPRQQESVGIVIERPSAAADTADAAQTAEPQAGQAPELRREQTAAAESAEDAGETEETETGRGIGTPSTRQTVLSDDYQENTRNGSRGYSRTPGRTNMRSSEKGGSAITDGTEAEPETRTDTASGETFEDRFTDEIVSTDNRYSSPNVSVTVTQETTADGRCIYYLADIYLRDVTSLRTALANDTYGSGYRAEISDMAALNDALVAVNGDYYGNTNEGVVIRNGVIYRANDTDCDVCVLYYDGTMRIVSGTGFSVEEAIEDGAWQAWTFGPALLNANGEAITNFSSTRRLISANPRTAIGYYEPGHYCLVVVDGRGESSGMTMQELSRLFASLGCSVAYNLDGGNSSVMVWNGEVVNDPSGGGRASSDAVLITEVTD